MINILRLFIAVVWFLHFQFALFEFDILIFLPSQSAQIKTLLITLGSLSEPHNICQSVHHSLTFFQYLSSSCYLFFCPSLPHMYALWLLD